jgi:hypothetical protein
LRRAIQRHIEDALSEAFIRGQIRPSRPIEISVVDGGLFYTPGRARGSSFRMSRRRQARALLLAAVVMTAEASPARAQEEPAPLVERVEILNNQFLQKETLLFYVSTKPGDRFDERRVREDFRRLWDTGFLDDLQVEGATARTARSSCSG